MLIGAFFWQIHFASVSRKTRSVKYEQLGLGPAELETICCGTTQSTHVRWLSPDPACLYNVLQENARCSLTFLNFVFMSSEIWLSSLDLKANC